MANTEESNLLSKNDIDKKGYLGYGDSLKELKSYEKINIIKKLDDDVIKALVCDNDFLQRNEISDIDVKLIIDELNDKTKVDILNTDSIKEKFKSKGWTVSELLIHISDEDSKKQLMDAYELDNNYRVNVVRSFSTKSKIDIVLSDNELNKTSILSSIGAKDLEKFFKNNNDFCKQNNIHMYECIKNYSIEEQQYIFNVIDEFDMDIKEKKTIVASLKDEVKQSIDVTNLNEEYKKAISLHCDNWTGKLKIDFSKNVEDYEGLDNLLDVNPEMFNKQEKDYFLKLCDVCPNLSVYNKMYGVVYCPSTAKEYKEAEKWISDVIDSIKPEYTNLQKMAIIDNAIGKKISYSPVFNTEKFDDSDNRAIWKIISSGYGVCNGIANIEQYMFKNVGIESEMIPCKTHTFLKVENVQISNEYGEQETGNTIIDPTWNLTSQRFGGRPQNFCINYETAREHDIDQDGKDHFCHLNDEKLQDATLMLSEQNLRELYSSVGLADKEGNFPLKEFVNKSRLIDEVCANNLEQNIYNQFKLLATTCPEFANCQESSMDIISEVLLSNKNINFEKCVVNRVYSRDDKERKPVIYTYIDSNEIGKRFYYADSEKRKFVDITVEEFINQFECYDYDLINSNGIRPWENAEQEKEQIDLSTSSGKVNTEISDGGMVI